MKTIRQAPREFVLVRALTALTVFGIAEPSARAQASDAAASSTEARAAELFREGRRLLEQQRNAEACDRFRQSLALKPSPTKLLNVGQCLVLENKPVQALATFERALEMAQSLPPDAKSKAWSEAAKREIDALRQQVAEVALRFSPTPGLEIRLNGEPIEVESSHLRLTPGSYDLRASAPGRMAFVRTFTAEPGAHLELTIPPLQVSAPPRPMPVTYEMERPAASAFPWVLVGTGSVVLGAGVVTGLMTFAKARELEDQCPRFACPSPTKRPGLQDEIDSSKRLAKVTDLLWGVGLATTGVGVGLLVLHGAGAPASAGEVQAGCFSDSCAVSLQGRF